MEEKEFLEVVSLHAETYYMPSEFVGRRRRPWSDEEKRNGYKLRAGQELASISLDDIILAEWDIDWGSEPQTWELDTILQLLAPEINEEQKVCLLSRCRPELVEYDEWVEAKRLSWDDYSDRSRSSYGGYSGDRDRDEPPRRFYRYKFVKLRRLFERLQGLGIL
jgi:hypothetical protein